MPGWRVESAHFRDCPPGWRHDYAFPDWDLWTVLVGSCTLRRPNGDLRLDAGDCLCLPPGVHHRIDPVGSTLRICAIHCHAPANVSPPLLRRFSNPAFALVLMQRIVRTQTSGNAYLEALCAERERQAETPRDVWWQQIEELCTAIMERPQIAYTRRLIARRLHCCEAHLSRRFHAQVGHPLSEFIITARINRACQYLAESDLAMKAVAELCGYASVHYFSRQFRQRCQVSPGAYRKQARTRMLSGEPDLLQPQATTPFS